MGGGMPNFEELRTRATTRAHQAPTQIFDRNGPDERMSAHRIKARESLASDTNPNPLPIVVFLDTSGSMGHVPTELARGGLVRFLNRITSLGAAGQQQPQICYSAVADYNDSAPFQFGQFEADNRMDEWLTRLHIGGGSGSASMHEAYPITLYALARKTECDIWKRGGKGHAFIIGDELCPSTITRSQIKAIFGDDVPKDLSTAALLAEAQQKWNISFLYVQTEAYGRQCVETINHGLEETFGAENVYRLDKEALGTPELMSALIAIKDGVLSAEVVPLDMRAIGVAENLIDAVATALKVSHGRQEVEAKVKKPDHDDRAPKSKIKSL